MTNLPLENPFVEESSGRAQDLLILEYNRKEYRVQTPAKNLNSPHKPRLAVDDQLFLQKYFDLSFSSSTLKASPETEKLFMDNVRAGEENLSLNSIPNAMEFCIEVAKIGFDNYVEWLWGYRPETEDEESVNFIKMIKYVLTDFHLNCMSTFKAINDERTPFVECIIPALKAFAKVLGDVEFIW